MDSNKLLLLKPALPLVQEAAGLVQNLQQSILSTVSGAIPLSLDLASGGTE